MFIKLTRLDGAPIWINAAFVVTVEPRKGGGAVVVPIGDGLDYDVRESPEAVLDMLGDAPAATVVPVPASDALTPTPDDVSPEPEPAPPPAAAEEKVKPARRQPRASRAKASAGAAKPSAQKKQPASAPKKASALGDEEIERLRRLMPGSLKKLQNTLVNQFNVADADAAIRSLSERGVLEIAGSRVVWRLPIAQ
ncbi:MAG: hypothetical protein IKE55_04645 [Kiritimatiellae bacterium]|nr:hypothetical protein [Kiritimatiellia bacterium]